MTKEQLKKYEDRLYELRMLIENCCISIKFNPNNRNSYNQLRKYSNEFKSIEKILKKAQKEAIRNEL